MYLELYNGTNKNTIINLFKARGGVCEGDCHRYLRLNDYRDELSPNGWVIVLVDGNPHILCIGCYRRVVAEIKRKQQRHNRNPPQRRAEDPFMGPNYKFGVNKDWNPF